MKDILNSMDTATYSTTQSFVYKEKQEARDDLMNDAYSHLKARVIHYAADAKIADYISTTGNSLQEIYHQLVKFSRDINLDALERLLHVLQNHHIIAFIDGKYYLKEKGKYLQSKHPQSIRAAIAKEYDTERWDALGHLHISINGGSSFRHRHQGKSFYEYLHENPSANLRFNEGMSNYSDLEHQLIPLTYNFSDFKTIVDVGGGNGELLQQLHQIYPQKKLVLVELASVVEGIKSTVFTSVTGDFFKPFNDVKGDGIILKRVLHNWSNEESLCILKNIKNVLMPKGKLLIIEKIRNSHFNGNSMNDADMLMLAMDSKARTRTYQQIQDLIKTAGYQLGASYPIAGCDLEIFEASTE